MKTRRDHTAGTRAEPQAVPAANVYAAMIEAVERFARANYGERWKWFTLTVVAESDDEPNLTVQHPPG